VWVVDLLSNVEERKQNQIQMKKKTGWVVGRRSVNERIKGRN
jgi:hypothetical protein